MKCVVGDLEVEGYFEIFWYVGFRLIFFIVVFIGVCSGVLDSWLFEYSVVFDEGVCIVRGNGVSDVCVN